MTALASSAPFDFFPFNLPSGGPFLAFYTFVIVSTLLLITALRSLLPRLLQRPALPPPTEDSPTGGDSPYRAAGLRPAPAHRPLTLGYLPRSDELYAIAYLKEGSRGVANLLIAQALAAGYLRPKSDGDAEEASTDELVFVKTATPSEPLARAFHDELRARKSIDKAGLQTLAESSAAASAPTITQQLESAALVPSEHARTVTAAVAVLVLLAALAIGGMRMIRLLTLHRYIAFLTMQMIFLGVVGLILALRQLKAPRGDEYLSWLDDATHSLRADVATGRRDGARDVGLALAVGGLTAVAAAPLLSPLGAVFIVPTPVVSTSSGSSCGGGSGCGGGGGCGGGCGGGGGCG
jgi:uncharacterized protein (TIGR04222 family)